MKTTENNKLIAEFMGLADYTVKTDGRILEKGKYTTIDYSSDWNSLMEVVEKIEGLGYSVNISPSMVYINGDKGTIIHPIIIGYNLSKIEAVYNACVLFINHYNTKRA
jgi:hypothetical protein